MISKPKEYWANYAAVSKSAVDVYAADNVANAAYAARCNGKIAAYAAITAKPAAVADALAAVAAVAAYT